jgi:hypothetical protein
MRHATMLGPHFNVLGGCGGFRRHSDGHKQAVEPPSTKPPLALQSEVERSSRVPPRRGSCDRGSSIPSTRRDDSPCCSGQSATTQPVSENDLEGPEKTYMMLGFESDVERGVEQMPERRT